MNFLRYDNAKQINSTIFDRANSASVGYSQRLAGGGPTSNERYGMAKSIAVKPGDVVTMDVFVKYLDPVTENWNTNTAFTNLIFAISGLNTGTFIEGPTDRCELVFS